MPTLRHASVIGNVKQEWKKDVMKHSKRARILARALEFINSGDWDDQGDFLIFGKEAFEAHVAGLTGNRTYEDASEITDQLRKLAAILKTGPGAREIAKRISLTPLPKDSTSDDLAAWCAQLSSSERILFEEALRRIMVGSVPSASGIEADETMDAFLASEALRQLDDALGRLSTFDEVNPTSESLHGPFGAEYFEEAHRCDLAGLKIASAVLCRAMLERL
jgi:hypothetical protein